ncbi:MAG: hypothetical protein VB049_08185 [Candidatus Pelethousia sp.]|nr:hypothetical protein [Candidatus Pelethousia sp.]
MKTLYIDASPKKRWSNSAYFMGFSRLFTGGGKCKLPRAGKYDEILKSIDNVDCVVLAMPLYVDGIPSHVLRFLQAWEEHIKQGGRAVSLYVIANCGFYEGRQTHHLIEQMRIWCTGAGVVFKGSLGIGAGEMLGILRLTPFIRLAISIMVILIASVSELVNGTISLLGLWQRSGFSSILITLGVAVLFSLGAAFHLFGLAMDIRRREEHPARYTTVWFCPRILFSMFAAIYWYIRMLVMHGVMPWKAFARADMP